MLQVIDDKNLFVIKFYDNCYFILASRCQRIIHELCCEDFAFGDHLSSPSLENEMRSVNRVNKFAIFPGCALKY